MVAVDQALIGLVVLVAGVSGYRYAYELARFSERLDSVGSTTAWGEVEPANWMVLLYQFSAIVVTGVGGLLLLGGVF